MSYTVALTGGIGSGKSTIASAFAALGVPVIDADIIAREVVAAGTPALAEIVARYGSAILTSQGTLDRPRLRQIIFSSADEKSWLNGLLHPLISQRTQQLKATYNAPYLLWVVPLLVENGLQHQASRVLVVDVDEHTQISRTMQRDGIDLQQARRILSAQATRAERCAVADDIINNSGAPDEALPQIALLHQRYLQLAAMQQG